MKKIFIIYSLLLSVMSYSQDVLSIVFEQPVAVYPVRSIESNSIDVLKPNDLLYIEPTQATMSKILFYSQSQKGWREGFAEHKFLQPISTASKSDKIRFCISYLKDFNRLAAHTPLESEYLANNFNLLIDVFLELACEHKNPPVTRFFIEALLHISYTYDEKHLYALEELYQCQRTTFLELLNKTDTSTQNKIKELMQEW